MLARARSRPAGSRSTRCSPRPGGGRRVRAAQPASRSRARRPRARGIRPPGRRRGAAAAGVRRLRGRASPRERVAQWVDRAALVGSPISASRPASTAADLAGRADLIAAEADHVVACSASHSTTPRKPASPAAREPLRLHGRRVRRHRRPRRRRRRVPGHDQSGLELRGPGARVERLAPLAPAGHVKDYELVSDFVDDRYHRRGWALRWRYPGEGVADLQTLLGVLLAAASGEFLLSVEGLDNRAGVADQVERLRASLEAIRHAVQMLIPS